MRESITVEEQRFIDDFELLEDWLFQFEYLMEKAGTAEQYPEDQKDESHRIPGCQSRVWVLTEKMENGHIHIRADSDSLLVKGMLAVAVELLNGRTPEEICTYQERYISETSLRSQITTDRFGGLHAAIQAIQEAAVQLSRLCRD